MCISAKQQLSLLKLTSIIASSLTKASKAVKSVGQPSKRSLDQSDVTTPSPKRLAKALTPIPATGVHYDNVGHWPECGDDKRKCRLCKTGQSHVFCSKCNICLSLSNARNCFWVFTQNNSLCFCFCHFKGIHENQGTHLKPSVYESDKNITLPFI